MEDTRVRVDLVTGFLGSGKTTFIRRYGAYLRRQGVSFGVIENEFGMAGVDTALLMGLDRMSVAELSGGCICCSLKADFARELVNQSQSVGCILVEPSGVFALDDFFDVMESPAVAPRCRVGSVIAVADPHMLDTLPPAAMEILAMQLTGCGCVVVSKLDEDGKAAIQSINRLMDGYLGSGWSGIMEGKIFAKRWEELTDADFAAIFGSGCIRHEHERKLIDHANVCSSATFYPRSVFTGEDASEALKRLMRPDCGAVLRIKGYVDAMEGGSYVLNAASVGSAVTLLERRMPAMINVIGFNLRRSALSACL